ncbi:hypothetical protein TKK_0008556 [Trichogramma kaykai]
MKNSEKQNFGIKKFRKNENSESTKFLVKNDGGDNANFNKNKEDFKRQTCFPGKLYSDLPAAQLASQLPYFHISDEYRLY